MFIFQADPGQFWSIFFSTISTFVLLLLMKAHRRGQDEGDREEIEVKKYHSKYMLIVSFRNKKIRWNLRSFVCLDLEFCFSSHLCQMWLIRDTPVVCGRGNRSTRRKPPPNPNSLATFLHAQAGIRTQAVVRDSVQSVAAP